jgi:hypothetical protein
MSELKPTNFQLKHTPEEIAKINEKKLAAKKLGTKEELEQEAEAQNKLMPVLNEMLGRSKKTYTYLDVAREKKDILVQEHRQKNDEKSQELIKMELLKNALRESYILDSLFFDSPKQKKVMEGIKEKNTNIDFETLENDFYERQKGISSEIDKKSRIIDALTGLERSGNIAWVEKEAEEDEINLGLELNKEFLQENYEKYIKNQLSESSNALKEISKNLDNFKDFARAKGFEVTIKKEKIEELYENAIKNADKAGSWRDNSDVEKILKIQDLAKIANITLEIAEDTKTRLQKLYRITFAAGKSDKIEILKNIATDHGIEIKNPSPEEIQDIYDELRNNIDMKSVIDKDEIDYIRDLDYSIRKNNKNIKIKKEVLQKEYEIAFKIINNSGRSLVDYKREPYIKKLAEENNVELENDKEIKENSYIEIIHSTGMSHAEYERNEVLKIAQEAGSKINYGDAVKMDYLDYLNIPLDQRLKLEKTVRIGETSIEAKFYGQKKSEPTKGKFIIGITPNDNLEFVFDGTMGEHKDIAAKNNLEIIGGGWLKIDEQNKEVTIYGCSKDYGYEPRSISKKAVTESFPDYKVGVAPINIYER